MPKKTGLGRGLDALFAENKVPEEEKIRPNEIVQNIKLIEIHKNSLLHINWMTGVGIINRK